MGVGFTVKIGKKRVYSFHYGSYTAFKYFRSALIRVIRGQYSSLMYDELMQDASIHGTLRANQNYANKEEVYGKASIKERDLDIFISHDDSSGHFTKRECIKLFALFSKYDTKFHANETISDLDKEWYDQFKSAFEMVAKSKPKTVAKVIFC